MSVSLCLCLRVMLCVVLCGVVSLWSWCCWWSWCVCVCLCVLRHAEKTWKNRVWIQKRLRVYIQNVPVCTGTTHTCVSTCARGAGTHGDVLNVHGHGAQGVIASSAYQNLPTYGFHGLQRCTKETFAIFKFENRLRTTCPRFLQ